MPFSAYLDGKRAACRALVDALSDAYPYVSVLGTDVQETSYLVDRRSSSARDGEGECGFVVRLHDGGAFFLLNPTYLTPYLPTRPEPQEPWNLTHQAVWEADSIIVDTPDFPAWIQSIEGMEELSEEFARRQGF